MAIKRIPTTSAQVGMYLCGIDRSWLNTPFLVHRFLIKCSSDIAKLQQAGIEEITIDTDRGHDVPSDSEPPQTQDDELSSKQDPPIPDSSVPPEAERLQQLSPSIQGKSLSGELTTMKLVRKYMLEGVQDILHTLQKTGGLAIEQVHQITESVMAETLGHEEACIAMIRTRDFSPALYDHALAVSTLAVLLGRAVGLDNTALQHLASAGLLHDAGLLNLPQVLHRPLNQLSDSELGLYQKHPRRGADMLSQQSCLADEVDTLIREHHIALDGSGYPANIDPAKIQTPTRILRIVDEYDELLTGHHTGKPLAVRVALQTLYQQGRKGLLDGELVATFINLIGIYPTYALVELSTGERGIVTANSRDNLLQPTILLIQDAIHQPLPEPIPFNFSVLSSHEPRPEIVRVLAPEQVGIDLDSALENWMTL
ncbi:HD domain-containing phosphohydrolase [uncultured Nitrospira sp.]|uniref:HD-GYP domain-containing protein n=1 Tax=uncultured Nitrospira sp. TaxID=157176 RepID=UPI0031406590